MAIQINGDGTITGISVGGLPDGIVDSDMLAAGAATQAKRTFASGEIIQTKFFQNTTQYSNNSDTSPTTIISGAITPTNSSNKIFITYHAQVAYSNGTAHCHVQIMKSGSVIDAARGSISSSANTVAYNANKVIYIANTDNNNRTGVSGSYSDTAGSTSAITYAIGINGNGGGSVYCHANRSAHSTGYGSSTELILMEMQV